MNPTEQLEQVQNELMCSICCDYFVRANTMSCSHSFCYYCINEWRTINRNCPTCRQPIYNMAPSRALDNMVAAVNADSNDIEVESVNTTTNAVETSSITSDSFMMNDDEYDTQSIDSDHDISEDQSNISEDFNSYLLEGDSQEELHEASADELEFNDLESNDLSDHNESNSSIFSVEDDYNVSTLPDDSRVSEYDDSSDDSVYTNYSHTSAVRNVTIKHTFHFLSL